MDNGASSYRRFLTGDDSALEALIEEYRLPLQMFLYSFTGDFELAEEAAIETFVKLAVKKPKYNGKASFKTWLYRIGRNTAADYIRKNRRNETLSLEESGVNITDAISPEDIYLKEEKNRQLALSMRKLKPEYYTVLWLKYFDGLQISEIAEIIRKSDGNTKVILSRAREALRIQLGKDGFDYED
ncbi:MAG: RNA polymerase sigma factor [Clostridia bacterium]|nr:RNA polymerase sigma factor [Clostridia bacterium]